MAEHFAPVVIVSGPPGAGKTTVATQLADRFVRSVHLETDFFFHAVRGGRVLPWLSEADAQNRMAVTAAARAVTPYALAGYAVVVDGVVLPWALAIFRAELSKQAMNPFVFVLLPDIEVTIRRGMGRLTRDPLDEDVYRHMHGEFIGAFASDDGVSIVEEGSAEDIVGRIYAACAEAGLRTL